MIKATLRYTDCLQDGRNLYEVLTNNKVVIASTKRGWSMYPRVVILVKDYDHLSCLLHELNTRCIYEVRLVKHHIVRDK